MSGGGEIFGIHTKDRDRFIDTTMVAKTELGWREEVMRFKPTSEFSMNKRLKYLKMVGRRVIGR